MINSLEDIKHVYYINLDARTDRKNHIEDQLNNIGITDYNRFSAIKNVDGAVGCTISHYKLIEHAIKENLPHILIVEDDLTFTNIDLFKTNSNKFFEKSQNNFDVLMFAGNIVPPFTQIDDYCVKIRRCATTSGYLVLNHYFKKLLNNFKQGLENLIRYPDERPKYAIDVYWGSLQFSDRWYLIFPLTVTQYENYSDIENRDTNYDHLMLVSVKPWQTNY